MSSWVSRLFQSKKKSISPNKTKSLRRKSVPPNRVSHPFRAVTVRGRMNCCNAARRLQGKRFLASQAPALPLGGCSQSGQCSCRYLHLTDRRGEIRRDTDFGLPSRNAGPDGERRISRDRRLTATGV